MKLLGPEENEEGAASKLLGITLSTAMWSGQYKLLHVLLPKRTSEWNCRIVSFLHGIIISILAYYSQLIEGPSMLGIEPGLPNNNTQILIVKICLGYFFFDITWCLYHQTEPPIMLFHHCVSIFGMVCTAFMCKWGTELVGVVALTEISNPLLQIRWFLKDQGYSKTLLGEIVDFSFIAVFGVCRLGMGGYLLVCYIFYPSDDILGKTGALIIFVVSIIFYYYILGYAFKKYSRMYFNSCKSNGALRVSNGTHSNGSPSCNGSQSNGHVCSQANRHTKVE